MRQSAGKGRFLLEASGIHSHRLKTRRPFSQLVVPDHKELDRGTLRAIIRQAQISVDEFLKLLA